MNPWNSSVDMFGSVSKFDQSYLLFGNEEYLFIFQEAYGAVIHYLFNDPWYVEVNMDSKALVWPLFNSLQAFWSGLQCPLQVGTVACRYYVMRYMCEIVSKDTNIITDAIDTRNSYSQLELDEVRVEWAEFLARYI
ncbi:uncharacterized protein LOC103495764 isoform X1 [Cucumis melo]|uniref:Uncharacterized protein LOC103495764 isoform X1 n=2 Tax=Cucumis melo TaxID=3656 RepID=A0ABM3L0L6_CUCME|nr:uncharacterized protein LOC103495764 isoform X1 [Cucumis melo]